MQRTNEGSPGRWRLHYIPTEVFPNHHIGGNRPSIAHIKIVSDFSLPALLTTAAPASPGLEPFPLHHETTVRADRRRWRMNPPGGWKRPFEDPIRLPCLSRSKMPASMSLNFRKTVAAAEHWQIAMEQLIDAAKGRNFIMHARIGMLRALNHGNPPSASTPSRKPRLTRL